MVVQQNHKKWKRFQLIDRLKIRSCELIERQTKLGKYVKKKDKITINDGYWVNVVHNWLYIAKYGAKSVYKSHAWHI